MGEPLVVVENLQKVFVHMGRPLEVLRGIDLRIDEGEFLSIVGSSGAGKSTLLHCIGTLDVPTRGRIRLGRDDLTGLSGSKLASIRNREIGFVFQFHHLLPEFTALENVMMPGLIQGRSQRDMKGPAMSLLREVGLEKRATHRPGELSGGEQQRVALARALVLSPRLILADEPTGNLDSSTSDSMQALFFEINAKHGTTIVVVTHDVDFASSMPRIVTMKDGKVANDEVNPKAGYRTTANGRRRAESAEPTAAAQPVAAKPASDADAAIPAEPEPSIEAAPPASAPASAKASEADG
jgi:lipoprotein-releasing system ATP-binding protein